MRTKYNPFVVASPLEQHYLTRICQVAEICYERGWVWATSGNFSVHLRDGLVWQGPSGKCKGHLKPEDFLPVSLDTAQVIRPEPGLKASEEMPVHLGIFDLMGKEVKGIAQGENFPAGSHEVAVSIDGLAPGIYFVQLRGEGMQHIERLVIR